MRLLFEDQAFAAADAKIVVHQVGLPSGAKRDVWFRFIENATHPDEFDIYAYATRAEAQTATPPATYLASLTRQTGAGTLAIYTLTDNAETDPVMTGLVLQATVAAGAPTGSTGAVWGYTAAPQLVTASNIVTILQGHADAGEALSAFLASDGQKRMRVGYLSDADPANFLAVRAKGMVGTGRSGPTRYTRSAIYEFEVQIKNTRLTDDHADAYAEVIEWLSTVESILLDENLQSKGEVLTFIRGATTEPAVEGSSEEDLTWVGTLTLQAEYNALWRDDIYPRT